MAQIQLNRTLKLREPLLNIKGERVDRLRLDGSFVLSDFTNSSYIYFDKDKDAWQFDFDLLVSEIIDTVNISANNERVAEQEQPSSILIQSIFDLSDVSQGEPSNGDILSYDEESSSFILRNINTEISSLSSLINSNSESILDLDNKVELFREDIPDFYYGTEMPEGTGTSQITEGSIWHSPASPLSDTINYVYIFDGENYQWVEI